MRMTVKMPRAAETVDDYVVTEWVVEVGAAVTAGDPLLVVETDKAQVEIPSPVTGTLVEQLVALDEEITTGTAVATVVS